MTPGLNLAVGLLGNPVENLVGHDLPDLALAVARQKVFLPKLTVTHNRDRPTVVQCESIEQLVGDGRELSASERYSDHREAGQAELARSDGDAVFLQRIGNLARTIVQIEKVDVAIRVFPLEDVPHVRPCCFAATVEVNDLTRDRSF